MPAFESWYEHKFEEGYEIFIYVARDCDEEALSRGELKPGKITNFQMSYDKFWEDEHLKGWSIDNPLIGGELLRDEIGHGPASDALTVMGIPKDIPVWKLGEKC